MGYWGHQSLKELQSVHPGHLDIEGQDIRLLVHDEVPGRIDIGSGADDFDSGIGRKSASQDIPREGGVVNDQYFNRISHSYLFLYTAGRIYWYSDISLPSDSECPIKK